MSDFLLELRSEEIPARMQAGARAELERLFRREMDAAGVAVGEVTVWSTPRRLALIARGLPDATEAVSEEAKGPPEGAPDAALDGFCRKNGVTRDQLELRDVKGRNTWFAVVEKPGRATREVLAEAIPAIVRDFSWPKSMRWGAASLSTESPRWVRPLSGIVAILGDELVACEAAGVRSGYATLGHRFHHCGDITIGGAHDYPEKLRACHVIVDHEERAAMIRDGAAKAAADAGLTLVEDEGLVVENAGLTEWPVPLLGRFDEAFLDVPPEVIQLTARVNQKYFVCTSPLPLAGGAGGGSVDGGGSAPTPNPSRKREGDQLANAFVCTANIAAGDGGAAIVDGNRKVLAARLSDARFFWEQDRKTELAEHAKKLERITFHEKLGTVADKVERVAKLARWLVEEGVIKPPRNGEGDRSAQPSGGGVGGATAAGAAAPPSAAVAAATSPSQVDGEDRARLADLAEQAALLCKADLVTEMVGEFPELQGVMGGYYARAEGLPDAVANAIRDHYKPVGQGDDVPTAPVTVAVSLADKLDTLVCFFSEEMLPTGSKDPFALRRATMGSLSVIQNNELRFPLERIIEKTARIRVSGLIDQSVHLDPAVPNLIERLPLESDDLSFMEGKLAEMKRVSSEIGLALKPAYDPKAIRLAVAALRILSELDTLKSSLLDFFADRLKVQQREAGVRHDLIDAVFALGGEDDLVRLLARVKALQHYIETAEGADLLAGYKRAANILKKEGVVPAQAGTAVGLGATPKAIPASAGMTGNGEPEHTGEEDPLANVDDPDMRAVVEAQLSEQQGGPKKNSLSYTPEPAEEALIAALDSSEPAAARAVEAEDFAGAMAALAALRGPIDRFFDEVTVNDPDSDKRRARHDLLARFRDAVHRVADFSRIEG